MSSLRRRFLAFMVLAYAFLGAGPSLWALGLDQNPPCSMGPTCAMRHGGRCCCRFNAALLKKFPQLAGKARPASSCEMRQRPLAPQEASDGQHSLPSQQPHLTAQLSLPWILAESPSLPQPGPRGSSFHPEPPTPIPD